jgi:archaellin
MVLVSSAAGSMIISNVDSAGQQAQTVVDQSLATTTNFLEIRSIAGVCDPGRGELIGLEMVVALGPGSDDLNLSSLVIELLLPGSHVFLSNDAQGYDAEKLLSRGTNDSKIIAHGDLFQLRFFLPEGLGAGQTLLVGLVPTDGFTTTWRIDVPDTISTQYIDLY